MSKKNNCIPTWYNGILFRSRTEAKTAILQDCLGLERGYEEESYSNNGTNYLPDFPIHQRVRVEVDNNKFEYWDDVFWEVKGREELSQYETDKILSFIAEHKLYISGQLPFGNDLEGIFEVMNKKAEEINWLYNLFDGEDFCWLAYPGRSKSGEFTFYQTPDSPDMDKLWTYKAYSIALNAQFEHGKKPRIKLTEKGPVNLQDLADNGEDKDDNSSSAQNESTQAIEEIVRVSDDLLKQYGFKRVSDDFLEQYGLKRKNEPRDKHISVFLTKTDYQDLKQISQDEKVSVNEIINNRVKAFINEHKEYPKSVEETSKELSSVELQDDLADKINEYEEMLVNPSSPDKNFNAIVYDLMSKKENRDHKIAIYVTEEHSRKLKALREATGVSVNSMVNAAIDLIIKDNRQYLQDFYNEEES